MIEEVGSNLTPLVRQIAGLYLEERAKQGGIVLVDDHNLELYSKCHQVICQHPSLGLCFADLEEPAGESGHWNVRGLSLWGPEFGLHTTLGRVCTGQFTYVMPEYRGKGVAKRMYEWGFAKLREKGFTHFAGAVEVGNELGEMNAKALMRVHKSSRVLQMVYVGEI